MLSSLCIVPHKSNEHTNNTIPHKLYQYMISQAVLVSSSKPLARIVSKSKSGYIFEAGNSADCSKKIIEAYNNPLQLKKKSKNGYDYVVNQGHNWENESAVNLINAYKKLH